MADGGEKRSYSVSEAASYAQGKIAYCDRVTAEYPDANMVALRVSAASFLEIIETQPRNLDRLRGFHDVLHAGRDREGTGWFLLMSYVGEYIEHVEKAGS